jgi:hypothetical protein
MTGRSYLVGGEPVTVVGRWVTPAPCEGGVIWHRPPKPNAPRNVLIERHDGSLTVRPSSGLRLPHATASRTGSQERRRHPDEVYKVTLCLSCRHPGGQHILGAGCRLCGSCAGWWPSPATSAWSDRMTMNIEAAAALPSPEGEQQ